MLDALRGQKTKKLFAWIMVLMVGVPFIFYYGWNTSSGSQGPMDLPSVAEVNGQPIRLDVIYRLRKDMALQLLPPELVNQMNPEQLAQQFPDDMVIDEAVRNALLEQMAVREGLELGPSEREAAIRAFTMRFGAPQDAPGSDVTQYFAAIAQQVYQYTPTQMLDYLMAQERRNRAAKAILFPQARTSILELWQAYEERHTEYRLACAVFRVAPRLATAEVSDADIEQHYEENQDLYTVGEKRLYDWVAVSRSEMQSRLEVTDAEVSADYQAHIEDYTTPAIWRLACIKLAAEEGVEDVPPVAQEIIDQFHQGSDFGDLALEHSIDPAVEIDRGEIGSRREDQLDERVVQALEGLASGEVTAPIHLGTEWHIYQVLEATPAHVQPFSEVSPEVRSEIENREIEDFMSEREDEFNTALAEYTSFEAMAAGLNLPVQTSEPVEPDSTYIPGLGSVPDSLGRDLRNLEVGETLPEIISTPDQIAILRLGEVRPQSVRPLDEALRLEIRLRVAQQTARESAEDAAFSVRQAALSAGDREASGEFFTPALEATGSSAEFEEIVTAPFQPLRDEIAEVGQIANLARALYYSPAGHLSDVEEIQSGDRSTAGYVVWIVRERITPELSAFYADLLNTRARVLAENQNRLVDEWYADETASSQNQIIRHDLAGSAN